MLGFSSLILNWTRKYRIHSVSRYSSSLFFVLCSLSPPSLLSFSSLSIRIYVSLLASLSVSLRGGQLFPIVQLMTLLLSIALPSSPPPPPILLHLLLNILFLVSNLVSPSAGYNLGGGDSQNCTLTPMHLRKAKLMFFWVRYPSSAIIKMYFPDIKFNKNNTAQLVKWFSNFR